MQIEIKDGSCECVDGKDAQRSDGCIKGERCESRCVHFQETSVMTCLDTGTVELDFMSWLDVNQEDVQQPEYRSKLCRKEIKRLDSTVLERSREYVMFLFSKAMTWKSEVSRSLVRKVMFSERSRVQCWADATREMAIELPPGEQAEDKDLIGEFLRLFHSAQTKLNSCVKEWQSVLIGMNFEVGVS